MVEPARCSVNIMSDVTLTSRCVKSLWQIAGWSNFETAALPVLQELDLQGLGDFRTVQTAEDVKSWRIAPDRLLIECTANLLRHSSDRLPVLDLSHARQVIEVSGPAARDLLSCVVPVDTRTVSFPKGQFVQTGLHQVGVLIHCTAGSSFDILVPTTSLATVLDILSENARAFNGDVSETAADWSGKPLETCLR